jgi:hypothetical protein
MTLDALPPAQCKMRFHLTRRWLGLVIGSVVLHWLVLEWIDANIGLPLQRKQEQTIIAQLQQPQPAQEIQAISPPVPVARHEPRSRRRPKSAVGHPATEPSPAPQDAPVIAPSAPIAAVETMPDEAAPAPTPPAVAPPAPPAQAEASYKVDPPPSVELKYDVQALRDGQIVFGHGKLGWQAQGNHYVASGEAGVLFFTVLNFKSEGAIDEFGVAPILYSEKRFRKSETNTHFHRERNTISFSASEKSYPRSGGEQDRASIIWQLAGIGRGDPGKFLPGAEIRIFVAGVRDAETWQIQVIGQEEIEIGVGRANTWHVARAPRAGSYDQQIDIWLAPQQEWYPVKIRYTEKNGDYLDLALSNVNPVAAP